MFFTISYIHAFLLSEFLKMTPVGVTGKAWSDNQFYPYIDLLEFCSFVVNLASASPVTSKAIRVYSNFIGNLYVVHKFVRMLLIYNAFS